MALRPDRVQKVNVIWNHGSWRMTSARSWFWARSPPLRTTSRDAKKHRHPALNRREMNDGDRDHVAKYRCQARRRWLAVNHRGASSDIRIASGIKRSDWAALGSVQITFWIRWRPAIHARALREGLELYCCAQIAKVEEGKYNTSRNKDDPQNVVGL